MLYIILLYRNALEVWSMMFNATFNNISVIWRSVLLVEETGVPREKHWPAAGHWLTLSHNVVSSTPACVGFELTTLVVICTDCIGSCKSNYHTSMTTTARNGQRKGGKTNNGHRKLIIEQHEPHWKLVITCDLWKSKYFLLSYFTNSSKI